MSRFSNCCVICGSESLGDRESDSSPQGSLQKVYAKGLEAIFKKCDDKGLVELHKKIADLKNNEVDIYVHLCCRKKLMDSRVRKASAQQESPIPSKRLRSNSSDDSFSWSDNCFLCTRTISACNIHRDHVHKIQTLTSNQGKSLHQKFVAISVSRGDQWGNQVLDRLNECLDLVSVGAKYHNTCLTRFKRQEKQNNIADLSNDKARNFSAFCEWFDGSCTENSYELKYLYERMVEMAQNAYYCFRTFKTKLKD